MPSIYENCNPYQISIGPGAPGNPAVGDVWWDTTHTMWYHWDGLAWVVGVPAPVAFDSPGTVGQVAIDLNYLYVCVATDVWKRTPLSTW